jgi:small conductance mechanosensitive channel
VRENRAKTVGLSFRSILSAIIILVGTILFLEEAGIDIKTLLGGAAILGLAVAFGAQNLMRDYFNGFLILIEDQYELNDVITVGNVTGVVEQLSMRITVLRDLEGRAHFIPNGQMKQVTNRTHQWSQALFDIGIAYNENVDQVMGILIELANELRKDPEYGSYIIGDPVMLGVDDFGDAAVRIKFLIKTKRDKMWPVRREMLRRIKNKFDELGISIPVPHRVIFQQQEDRGA